MSDLVQIDRDALADLIVSIQYLATMVGERALIIPLSEEEANRLLYIDKLVNTSAQSFQNNNQ